jgi:deoxyhypusine synthase
MVKYQIMSMGLFNNGFDYAVFINDGMEFDGSDSG